MPVSNHQNDAGLLTVFDGELTHTRLVAVREKKLVIKEKHLKVLTSFNVKSKR
jgi:hypothetical protein